MKNIFKIWIKPILLFLWNWVKNVVLWIRSKPFPLRTAWNFVKKYNEWFFSFPIGFLIFYYGTQRMFRSGLDVYDMGVSQKLLIATAFFFFILGMARVAMKLQWPGMSKLNDEDSNTQWKEIPYTQFVWLSFISLWVFILSLSILIASI